MTGGTNERVSIAVYQMIGEVYQPGAGRQANVPGRGQHQIKAGG